MHAGEMGKAAGGRRKGRLRLKLTSDECARAGSRKEGWWWIALGRNGRDCERAAERKLDVADTGLTVVLVPIMSACERNCKRAAVRKPDWGRSRAGKKGKTASGRQKGRQKVVDTGLVLVPLMSARE